MKLVLALVLLFVSCAGIKRHEITLPDGDRGYAFQCEVTKVGCYKLASKACPDGYHVIDQDGAGAGESDVGAVGGFAMGSSQHHTAYTFLVKCRSSENPAEAVGH